MEALHGRGGGTGLAPPPRTCVHTGGSCGVDACEGCAARARRCVLGGTASVCAGALRDIARRPLRPTSRGVEPDEHERSIVGGAQARCSSPSATMAPLVLEATEVATEAHDSSVAGRSS